ncbi:MAG: sec-independent protein translocase protein TatA [Bacteroidetes bacterium]|nr:MAG: sec-independent protein translocase protein TatA [Bacteroidota bacterium]
MLPQIILFLNLGAGEIFLIILVVIMFFGTKNLPQLARGLGKGIRDFKEAAGNIQREIQTSADEIRQNTNLGKEMQEITEAAAIMQGDIQEGLNNIDRQITESAKEEEKKETDQLPPADPEQEGEAEKTDTENTTPENNTQDTDTDNPIPGSIKRG